MAVYSTPGVYVEEIPAFPPSIAAVATAVPAFVGYTETAVGADTTSFPTTPFSKRIETYLEYQTYFGGPPADGATISFDGTIDNPGNVSVSASNPTFLMAYAVNHYFLNGGGPCFIVTLGTYGDGTVSTPDGDDYTSPTGPFQVLQEIDEPTLIVMPDATGLSDYASVYEMALSHCGQVMKDRFAILDVQENDTLGAGFRDNVNSEYSDYGAVYTPWLETSLTHLFDPSSVTIAGITPDPPTYRQQSCFQASFSPPEGSEVTTGKIVTNSSSPNGISVATSGAVQTLTISFTEGSEPTGTELMGNSWWGSCADQGYFSLSKDEDG
ncbi:MAG: hypothetical protein AAF585_23395, partial [Verrucomicrobiota bacterium]